MIVMSRIRLFLLMLLPFMVACSAQKNPLLNPSHPEWTQQAPDSFVVKVETSQGDFEIAVTREFAQIGSDRFYNLIRMGYYDDARFHRVVPGFIVQFGLAGKPELSQTWMNQPIADDANKISNVRGTIAFAFTEPGTRTTQLYINMVNNSRLDAGGFAPLGRVTKGMEVVDKLYSGYGESSGGGVRRGDQSKIVAEGNDYLDREFPKLDQILRAYILNP